MAQSINTKVDLVIKATSYQGLNSYGKIMVGDKAFEYYNDRNVNDFIQIPWEEVDYVIASVMFKGKKIPRYAIQTKKNGTYSFASKERFSIISAYKPPSAAPLMSSKKRPIISFAISFPGFLVIRMINLPNDHFQSQIT